MKKKITAIALASLMILAAFACEKKPETDVNDVSLRTVNMSEYVTLGQYKGLEITIPDATVSEEEIDAVIDSMLEEKSSEVAITDRASEEGDKVKVLLRCYVDGAAIADATTTNTFVIGDGSAMKEVDEAARGLKTSEKKDVEVSFADDYGFEELAGKDAVLRVEILAILPSEIDDDIVARLGVEGCSTVKELREYVKSNLESINASYNEDKIYTTLLSMVSDNSTFADLPEKYMEDQLKQIDSKFSYDAGRYGLDVDEYISFMYEMTKEELAEKYLHQRMLVEAIAQQEGISMDDVRYYSKVDELAKEQEINREAYFVFNNVSDDESFRESLTLSEVCDVLYDNAVIKSE